MRKVKFAKNGKISKNTQNATALVCVCLCLFSILLCACALILVGNNDKEKRPFYLLFGIGKQALKSEYIEHLFSLGHKEDFTKKFWEYMSDSACTKAALIVHAHTNISTQVCTRLHFIYSGKQKASYHMHFLPSKRTITFFLNHGAVCLKIGGL